MYCSITLFPCHSKIAEDVFLRFLMFFLHVMQYFLPKWPHRIASILKCCFAELLVVTFVKSILRFCVCWIDVVKTVAINNNTIHKFSFLKAGQKINWGNQRCIKFYTTHLRFLIQTRQRKGYLYKRNNLYLWYVIKYMQFYLIALPLLDFTFPFFLAFEIL